MADFKMRSQIRFSWPEQSVRTSARVAAVVAAAEQQNDENNNDGSVVLSMR